MDKQYLSEDFDPGKVKVGQLRSILRENNVEFPAAAKKRELVKLFQEKISPKKATSPVSDRQTPSESEVEVVVISEDEAESKPTASAKPSKKKKKKVKEKKEPVKSETESEVEKVQSTNETLDSEQAKEQAITPSVKQEQTEETDESNASTLSGSENKDNSPGSEKPGKSKKRKSSALDNESESNTPTKGNIFQVDVDSDTDTVIFSPKHKKSRTVSPAREPKSEKRRVTSRRKGSQTSISPAADIAKLSYQDAKRQLSRATPTKETGDSTPDISKNADSDEPQRKVSVPVLAQVPDSTAESSENQSILEQSSAQSDESKSLKDDFVDDASHFDSALSDLKHQIDETPEIPKEAKDEQLARLFGVDIGGVKPKARGRRNITPRRPIIVSERRLSSQGHSLVHDLVADQVASSETSPSVKAERKEATLSDEEADTDIEDDEDIMVTKPASKQTKLGARKSAKLRATFLFMSLWVVFLGLAVFGYWHREQTILIGYCGHEIDRATIPSSPETPAFLTRLGKYLDDNFKPSCIPCPQHARCFPRLNLACYEDFVEYKPAYYDIWPALDPKAKKCIPDTKKAEKVELMIDEALELLRARNANIQCGSTAVDNFEAGIEVNELHDLLLALKAPYITEEEFEDLWKRSVIELEKEPEITVKRSAHNVRTTGVDSDSVSEETQQDTIFRSTSLSHITLMCHLSNHMVDLLISLVPYLAITGIVMLVALVSHAKYRQGRLHAQRVETLNNEVLSKLRRQAKLARESKDIPAYIGSIQLRDLILSNEGNLAKKMRLWEAVSRKVDRNTNVKASLLEVHGEVMKVWEWISHLE